MSTLSVSVLHCDKICKIEIERKEAEGGIRLKRKSEKLLYGVFLPKLNPKPITILKGKDKRFSPDDETSISLVQHEGGPCGVLAAIQELVKGVSNTPTISVSKRLGNQGGVTNIFG